MLLVHLFYTLIMKAKKSPCAHVCDRSDRSKRRKTFPFALTNYKLPKEHLENK